MIAIDAFEQLHAKPFYLISADAACDGITGPGKISVEKDLSELSHGEASRFNMCENLLAILETGNGRMQGMSRPREHAQLRTGIIQGLWLAPSR